MKRSTKIVVIAHLCLAFSYVFWLLLQPTIHGYALRKSEESLFQGIFEREALFSALPNQEQLALIEGYQAFQERPSPAYFHELRLLISRPATLFALTWCAFSLLVCLLFILHHDIGSKAVWLLPLIVLGYGAMQFRQSPREPTTLFPTQAELLENYSPDEPLTKTREALKQGWHRYLVQEWAHETPSNVPDRFAAQLDKGLFAFNLQRLKNALSGEGRGDLLTPFARSPSMLLLALYLIWNCFVAWTLRWKSPPPSTPLSSANSS